MDWHIITASKGGVGKTLLSLMLLTYFHKDNDKSIFAIDLNGTNPDFRRLCCIESSELFEPVNEITVSSGQSLELISYRVEFDKDTQYVVGWPSNPYQMLCKASDFFDFLGALKEVTFSTPTKVFKPNTIIIDTNFHFGNLFSSEEQIYNDSKIFSEENETNDNFFIWFMWTNRQLLNLFSNNNLNESQILFQTVEKIEKFVKNTNNISPFVHVFNAFNLGNPNSRKWWLLNKEKISVSELQDLLAHYSEDVISFQILYNRLKKLSGKSREQKKHEEPLLKILDKYANKHKCSRNMIPLTTYQKLLENYTESDLSSLEPKEFLESVENLTLFKDFEVALERLLENDS